MSSRKRNLHKQADILHQIAKTSDAIRRKHKLMKLGKETDEQSLNEIFTPIVTPLEKKSKCFKKHNKAEN